MPGPGVRGATPHCKSQQNCRNFHYCQKQPSLFRQLKTQIAFLIFPILGTYKSLVCIVVTLTGSSNSTTGSPQQAQLGVIKIMRFIFCLFGLILFICFDWIFPEPYKKDQSHCWKLASKNCTLHCSQGSNSIEGSPQQAQLKL